MTEKDIKQLELCVEQCPKLPTEESKAKPGRQLARCVHSGTLGTGSTPEYAQLDLKRLLESILEDARSPQT